LFRSAETRLGLGLTERDDVERTNPVALAGEPQTAKILRYDEITYGVMCRVVYEHLPGTGGCLQASRDVDRVTDDGVVHAALGADVAGDDLASSDSHPCLQPHARHRGNLEKHDLRLQFERRPDCPF